ncbi:MAG TPA: Ig-like domain-containing protein, partial [Gemmatimonadales bacterium]
MNWRFKLSCRLALLRGPLLAAAALAACSSDRPLSTSPSFDITAPSVGSVTLTPTVLSMAPGDTARLSALLRNPGGETILGMAVTWATNAPTVAKVSASGLVTAVTTGNATITASAGGHSGTAAVTVTGSMVPVASIAVTPATNTLTPGATVQLAAQLKDASGKLITGRTITWTTSSSAVARISASGLLTGVAPGSATITASSGGRSGSASVTVSAVGGGGSGGGGGTGVPGNIYNWGFEGTTDAAASGAFVDSHNLPFIGAS